MYASSLATGAGGHISTAVTWEVSLVFSSRSTAPLSRKAKCCGSSLCSTGAFNTYVLLGVKYQFKSVTFSSFFLKIEDYILRRNIHVDAPRRFTNLWHIQTESSDLIEALSMTIWMVSLHYVHHIQMKPICHDGLPTSHINTPSRLLG